MIVNSTVIYSMNVIPAFVVHVAMHHRVFTTVNEMCCMVLWQQRRLGFSWAWLLFPACLVAVEEESVEMCVWVCVYVCL